MIFASRRNRGPDQYLSWKVRSFFVGAVLALVGIGTESTALVAVAIFVLLAGIVFRFLPGAGRKPEDEEGEGGGELEEEEEEDEAGGSSPGEPPQ